MISFESSINPIESQPTDITQLLLNRALRGKAVLVTGGSKGIGAAIARGFADAGAHVAIHYNASAASAEKLRAAIVEDGGKAICVGGDFSNPKVARATVETAAKELGGLDVLINNAGAMVARRDFMEVDDALIDAVLDLNVKSLIAASQAAVPYLEAAGRGAIVNLGSIAGADGGSGSVAHYAGAKGFVHSLTRSMARGLAAKGIRVNAIAPGVINTSFHAATPPDILDRLKSAIVMGRLGIAEDCVGPTLFLSSQAASGYMTGQILHINGGQYMG